MTLGTRSLVVCCFLMRTELTNALLGWASTWHEIVSTEATSALDATDQTLQKAGRTSGLKMVETCGNCSETSSIEFFKCLVCLCINPFDTALGGQVIRDFKCTIITIAHRIQTLFLSQKSQITRARHVFLDAS